MKYSSCAYSPTEYSFLIQPSASWQKQKSHKNYTKIALKVNNIFHNAKKLVRWRFEWDEWDKTSYTVQFSYIILKVLLIHRSIFVLRRYCTVKFGITTICSKTYVPWTSLMQNSSSWCTVTSIPRLTKKVNSSALSLTLLRCRNFPEGHMNNGFV
jgi:hypothetical protein